MHKCYLPQDAIHASVACLFLFVVILRPAAVSGTQKYDCTINGFLPYSTSNPMCGVSPKPAVMRLQTNGYAPCAAHMWLYTCLPVNKPHVRDV